MDKYSSFEMFMIEVVNKANSISDLNELFDVKYDALISTILNIIKTCGWWVFIALCTLLALGPITFGLTMGSFLLTPIGLIIGGVLGIAAATIIRQMYRNKELPLAIKKVGTKYESSWKAANGNIVQIDDLYKKAVTDLLNAGKHSLSSYAISLLNNFLLK